MDYGIVKLSDSKHTVFTHQAHDVYAASHQRQDVALTLIQSCLHVVCLLVSI